jgi:cytochrome P450
LHSIAAAFCSEAGLRLCRFAAFGFGYRRCPGERLAINVFEDFLRKLCRDKIVFRKLNLPNPAEGRSSRMQ